MASSTLRGTRKQSQEEEEPQEALAPPPPAPPLIWHPALAAPAPAVSTSPTGPAAATHNAHDGGAGEYSSARLVVTRGVRKRPAAATHNAHDGGAGEYSSATPHAHDDGAGEYSSAKSVVTRVTTAAPGRIPHTRRGKSSSTAAPATYEAPDPQDLPPLHEPREPEWARNAWAWADEWPGLPWADHVVHTLIGAGH